MCKPVVITSVHVRSVNCSDFNEDIFVKQLYNRYQGRKILDVADGIQL